MSRSPVRYGQRKAVACERRPGAGDDGGAFAGLILIAVRPTSLP